MKWTMTIAEMDTLFDLNLYELSSDSKPPWGRIALPNPYYCKRNAPKFEWHDKQRHWHVIGKDTK